MTTKPPPPAKGAKPFLGDDDLASELDQWDATFDALHFAEAGAGGGEGAAAPVVRSEIVELGRFSDDQGSDEGSDPTAVVDLDAGAPSPLDRLGSEFDVEVDAGDPDDDGDSGDGLEVHTLDGTLERPAVAGPVDRPSETDFSGLATPVPEAGDSGVLGAAADDDDVFTSASRPNRAPPNPLGGDAEDEVIAPPPSPPGPPGPPEPQEPRRTPAIVRRSMGHTVPQPIADNMFLEQTRITGTSELEAARAIASRQSVPVVPPPVDDDAYDDIEIEADAAPSRALSPSPIENTGAVRRTAHVFRREAPTRPPPAAMPVHTPSAVIEMEADDELSEPVLAARLAERGASQGSDAEEDFSDVAAAVGAADDPANDPLAVLAGLDALETPDPDRYRATTAGESSLDDALTGLTAALPDEDVPEDEILGEQQLATPPLQPRRAPPGPPPAASPVPDTMRGVPMLARDLDFDGETVAAAPRAAITAPRVKTPTSVPPLGARQLSGPIPSLGAAIAAAAQVSGPVAGVDGLELAALDLDAACRAWPEQIAPLVASELDETSAEMLLVYEREVSTLDDGASSAALRIEAGRLSERLADNDRARAHYDAALLADPRATAALRGLRRIARASGDLVEATRHLDSELAVAGALERRPLGHHRIDLLMASGDQDLARVAVGEILDSAPSDVRALLAHLELAFLDGRADEFGSALEQLAHAVSDHELRAAVQSARGALAAHHNDIPGAVRWFSAAAESDGTSLAARLGTIRYAAAQADGGSAARALLDLARQVETHDPLTTAAAAARALHWDAAPEAARDAVALADRAAPRDPLIARLAAETAPEDPAAAALAFAHWAACATVPAERAYAAARAAELDPARGAELWSTALELDPGDDYAAAQLRTAHVASESTQASIDVDLAVAADAERERARLRAAYGLIAQGQLDAAIRVLADGRAARPTSLALAEALGEALAAAGKWTERAKLFAELAADPGDQLDREVAQLRSALAWEEAVGAAAAIAEVPAGGEDVPDLAPAIGSALEAWERVLEHAGPAPSAHAASIVLASRLGDRDIVADVLTRAQRAERTPAAAASLALRKARLFADDPPRVEAILRDLQPADDPRRTVALVMTAARMKDLPAAAAALEERATQLDERSAAPEVAALRLRAAQLALDSGDAARATKLLGQVELALPGLGVVPDLLAAARRRAGDRPSAHSHARRSEPAPGASTADVFGRVVRDADLAAAQGDHAAAHALYQRALELRPNDPLAAMPLIRVATLLREPGSITGLALAQLKLAEDADDGPAKATAYELLAHVDAELRGDTESAQAALESAAQADPARIDLVHRLERHHAIADDLGELLRLRRAAVDALPEDLLADRTALLLDLAGLATRAGRTEVELADLYRAVLAADPASRLGLLHLEVIVRGSGFSEELAQLEEQIATYFEGEPRTQAAFWTRAGETLAELGQIDAAVQRFGRAEAALPGHVPALEGWRQAALKGQLWIDVAEAASRQAAGTSDATARAALNHFAGVALMDKALVGDKAMAAFQRALEAAPDHRDAFLRLRILLEEDANHDDLAALLARRLAVETAHDARIELHRALAELHRNFLSDRDTAKLHYRAILDDDANDLRAHAAIADIAWEQGAWQEAADALMSRARLETQPDVLKTLCFRLGLIYADRLVDVPMALKAFQRALSYQPDDENTLIRLADLAVQIGEYKLALGACERLVKNESDPDRRAAHLHRVARIFLQGFGDAKRAERALNLALDGAPTNDDALQQLVQFYKDARDITSARVHLNRVAGAMRARVQLAPLEGVPYRVIARAMAARAATGHEGSLPIARAAAQLADLLGAAGDPEQRLLMESPRPDLSLLNKPDADDVIFPRSVQIELRQIFHLLGDRIAKHVGVDLRPYGMTRGDRLRARENPVAAVAQSVATSLGFGEIDVYVSNRQPWAMIAEPTSPVSLIIGASVAGGGGDAIRFAAGGALKLAQASLGIPARLAPDDLGVLVVALMRLFQPEFPVRTLDPEAIAGNLQKLKRLIPTSLLNELRPFALAVDPSRFGHRELARDLRIAGLRAGLVASGSLLAGLRILAAQSAAELPAFLEDPLAQGLVSFALGEDHAAVAR